MSAEDLAQVLRASHPDAEPWDVSPAQIDEWLRELGVENDDGELVAAVLTEWDRLIV